MQETDDIDSVDFGLPFGLGAEGLFPLETPPERAPFPGRYQDLKPGSAADYKKVVESTCHRATIRRHDCYFHGFGSNITCAIMNAHYECHKLFHSGMRGCLLPSSDDCFVCQVELQGKVTINEACSKVLVEEISLFPSGPPYYWKGVLLSGVPNTEQSTSAPEPARPVPRKLTRKVKRENLLNDN